MSYGVFSQESRPLFSTDSEMSWSRLKKSKGVGNVTDVEAVFVGGELGLVTVNVLLHL